MNLYEQQLYNYFVKQYNDLTIPLEFVDSDNEAIDITGFDVYFSMFDRDTQELVIERYHDDGETGGMGVYFYGDTEAWSELGLTASNQLVVVLTSALTYGIDPGTYPFDLEFRKTINGSVVRKVVASGKIEIQDNWNV